MIVRLKIIVRGAVQGVGFRPFIYRLAVEYKLNGYVLNSSKGVIIEVEGEEKNADEFLLRIETGKPKISVITGLEFSKHDPAGYDDFEIIKSDNSDEKSTLISPDISVCPDCLNELFNPSDRRHLYPFINCTNCGPRYSIIESLPYDRKNTSMKIFEMCDACREEYQDPLNRRFHAQPIACPDCGPSIQLTDKNQKVISEKDDAISKTVELLISGKIIALKGLGGFQLISNPFIEGTTIELRKRKNREEKPFALMAPSMEYILKFCDVNDFESRLLNSPEAPIVFLKKKPGINLPVFSQIAPGNPYLGVMLPYTPLHHLLMYKLNCFIIATSGNLSEEPMCCTNKEAFERLGGIADYFLIHNRPIVRPVDDSVLRVINQKELMIRRARGYAPFPVILNNHSRKNTESVLAVGGHLKNTIALKKGDNVFVSPHIGDLSNFASYSVFENTCLDLQNIYETSPAKIIHDLHPEYLSTKFAAESNKTAVGIQHHLAHVISCKTENQVEGDAVGVSWDGTGLGLDSTIWGSEFFLLNDEYFSHIAQFQQFRLPGGEKAIKEPRRSALGILYQLFSEDVLSKEIITKHFDRQTLNLLIQSLKNKINSPLTSSAGRIFDAAASILDICQVNNYEGQAGMMLEFKCIRNVKSFYNFQIKNKEEISVIKWDELFMGMLSDIGDKVDAGIITMKFHNTLARIILEIIRKIDIKKVVLSGGCFQNMILTEITIELLESEGYKVYTHQRIPPNDGGISLGQAAGYFYKQVNKNHFLKLTAEG